MAETVDREKTGNTGIVAIVVIFVILAVLGFMLWQKQRAAGILRQRLDPITLNPIPFHWPNCGMPGAFTYSEDWEQTMVRLTTYFLIALIAVAVAAKAPAAELQRVTADAWLLYMRGTGTRTQAGLGGKTGNSTRALTESAP